MRELNAEVNSFYRSWFAFEQGQTTDCAVVFDFDYSQDRETVAIEQFENRFAVLARANHLLARARSDEGALWSNQQFLVQKLRGAEAYLRQLLGQHIPLGDYIDACMGYRPALVGADELELLQGQAMQQVSNFGLQWSASEVGRLNALLLYSDAKEFQSDLERHSRIWVPRVCAALNLSIEPQYHIHIVEVDEYWSNWITGNYGEPIELRINTHPRVPPKRGKSQILAAHELAGHAVHILSLSKNSCDGHFESSFMNTSLFSAEMFQMEGVAQTVLWILADEDEIEPFAKLSDSLDFYHMALVNNAQLELEAGRPVEEVVQSTLAIAPFLNPLTLASDLRDRSRNPLFRSYVSVYYPSWRLFSKARTLSTEKKREFLRQMYTRFWTPQQIAGMLADLSLGG